MHQDYPERQTSTGMRCAGQGVLHYPLDVQTLYEHLRATAIPRALRGEVCEPLALNMVCKFANKASRKWVRFCAEHKKINRHPYVECLFIFLVTRTGIEPMFQP